MPDHRILHPDPCVSPDPKHECSPPPVLVPPSDYPPPPPSSAASHGRGTFVTALIIAGSVVAFLALCLSVFLLVRRRRQRRRQREALLEAALAPAAAPPAAPPDDGINSGDEEVVHHAWHIRTVGLDEAAIESIALTRYRAGGALGASGCTVCLCEFQDGELLRLLPKCAHAFHVQCIDTWLRAHVNCPLCRANVTDHAAEQPDPTPTGAGADTEQEEQGAGNTGAPEHEQPGQHADEQRAQIDQRDQPSISSEQPRQRPGPRGRSFRRMASMDSPSPVASAEEAPEHGQAGGEKEGTGGAVCCEVSPGSDRLNRAAMKRSLSAGSRWTLLSRHCRARTSLLPL
ncbi:E3 ubiquitin-protein ligase RING1-like [Panicum miliaceum]|uniref:RING-type E3 ubiquitin transferase n=1 Tax=Panicum miliaceum TaxID=4540 RepID=A0A3L6RU15_PANMI|nr:E3 ubiquitin-protein ligase RING1-like [Panicum miliaceum]